MTYSINNSWDSRGLGQMREELRELSGYLLSNYRRFRTIPVESFQNRPEQGLFICSAGQNRLALAADGRIWGCRFFADFFSGREELPEFEEYCFGDIADFMAHHEDIYSLKIRNYRKLRMDNFSTEKMDCRECAHLLFCDVCPATAAFSTGQIGKIPAWQCAMKKIWYEAVRGFWDAAEKD
ncbi:MAG: SPASM domain-containing protein [Candidatus Aminicenantales bacterium]